MAEHKITIGEVDWRGSFPVTHLFRAFRVAIHPTKLLLALAAILLMYVGGRGLDLVWPQRFLESGFEQRASVIDRVYSTSVPKPFAAFLHDQTANINGALSAMFDGHLGLQSGFFGMLSRFVVVTPATYWQANQVFFTLLFAWFLLVIALFGGAIARIAAVQVARDEQIPVRQAIAFAWSKMPSFVGAPLIPALLVLLFGVLMSLMGLILYIPAGVGPLVVGALLVVFFAVGVLLALLIVGAFFGGAMMFPTIAVEASDAFDAVSRSYSYVVGAPWRLLWYSLIATFYGALTFAFVKLFVLLAMLSTRFFLGWWIVDQSTAGQRLELIWPAPTLDAMGCTPAWGVLKGIEPVAAGATCFWVYLLVALVAAYGMSFYFSSNTIIYYLLRRQVDATEMDEVFMQEEEEEPLPAMPESEPAGTKAEPASPASSTPAAAAAAPATPASEASPAPSRATPTTPTAPATTPESPAADKPATPAKPAEPEGSVGDYM